MSPRPLCQREQYQVKSSHPSRLAEVCLAVGMEGGRPGGKAGNRRASPQRDTAVQTNELATVPLSCGMGTGLKLWGFLQPNTGHWTNLTGSYCWDYTVQKSSFRPVTVLAFGNQQLVFHTGWKMNRLKNYKNLYSIYISTLAWIKHTCYIIFLELYVCYLYSRGLLLWRSRPTETREYQTQFMLTSTSAMARGRGASTSALPTCLQTVTILWICTPFNSLWHWRHILYTLLSLSRVFLRLLTYINYSLQQLSKGSF